MALGVTIEQCLQFCHFVASLNQNSGNCDSCHHHQEPNSEVGISFEASWQITGEMIYQLESQKTGQTLDHFLQENETTYRRGKETSEHPMKNRKYLRVCIDDKFILKNHASWASVLADTLRLTIIKQVILSSNYILIDRLGTYNKDDGFKNRNISQLYATRRHKFVENYLKSRTNGIRKDLGRHSQLTEPPNVQQREFVNKLLQQFEKLNPQLKIILKILIRWMYIPNIAIEKSVLWFMLRLSIL